MGVRGGAGDGLGLGEGLQPGEDRGVVLAGFEAAIELSSDGRRKKGDIHGNAGVWRGEAEEMQNAECKMQNAGSKMQNGGNPFWFLRHATDLAFSLLTI